MAISKLNLLFNNVLTANFYHSDSPTLWFIKKHHRQLLVTLIFISFSLLSSCINPPLDNDVKAEIPVSEQLPVNPEIPEVQEVDFETTPLKPTDIGEIKVTELPPGMKKISKKSPNETEPYKPTLEELALGRLSGDDANQIIAKGLKPTIYFDFNDHELSSEAKETLDAYSNFMSKDINISLILEGHTDNRGTSQYNLSLGLKRAIAIKTYLLRQGVSVVRLYVETFGEERPVLDGHEEVFWRYNRRVEIYLK